MEEMDRLNTSTLSSRPITHSRMKMLASIAQSTEDHIARMGLALSLRRGGVEPGWKPSPFRGEGAYSGLNTEKQLRGKTLFKDGLALWMALALRHETPKDYGEWRRVMIAHWERGVEELASIAAREGDWVRTLRACLPS